MAAATGKNSVDAGKRLAALGGRDCHDVRVSLFSEFQRVYSVVIDATDGRGTEWSWREAMEWNGAIWDFAPLVPATITGVLART